LPVFPHRLRGRQQPSAHSNLPPDCGEKIVGRVRGLAFPPECFSAIVSARSPERWFGCDVNSLRSRLALLWVLSLGACIAVGVLLVQFYQQSTAAQVGHAQAVTARACDLIRDRYAFYAAGWRGPAPPAGGEGLRRDLTAAVTLAIARQDGVEGGIWQVEAGPLAYAFPTYQGSGPKTDLPEAERDRIRAVNERTAREEQPVDHEATSRSQTLLLHGCPLAGPIAGLTAWTMMRVQAAPGYDRLRLGLGLLLALVLGMSGWLTRVLLVWTRHVRAIETALGRDDPASMPTVERTGERELDRIIDALNEAGRRLAAARQQSETLAAQVAASERLAALGRVAAGVAHEIRNPIAAMRLRAENALAADDARRRKTLEDMLALVGRLDGLVTELLAMTQRREPHSEEVKMGPFLTARVEPHREEAALRDVGILTECALTGGFFDPEIVGRILENLLVNAVRHTPTGGHVKLCATAQGDGLRLTVADTGPGVPSELRDHLFEPFVTGRADGTGLGLAIARELADAHGGKLTLLCVGGDTFDSGAVFALDLPGVLACRAS
jgi:signal transduction histidine kinase